MQVDWHQLWQDVVYLLLAVITGCALLVLGTLAIWFWIVVGGS